MRQPIVLLATAIAGTLLSGAVCAQTLLRDWRGAALGDDLGRGLADVGDFDGDRIDDLAIGIPGDDTVAIDAGSVVIVSGATGRELHRYFGSGAHDNFGLRVDRLGDVDLDGTVDFLVNGASPGPGRHTVSAVSGRSGAVLWVRGSHYNDGFGTTVAALGDTNHDGVVDVAIAAPGGYSGTSSSVNAYGWVGIYSGADGGLLQIIDGTGPGYAFGTGMAAAGDVDGDGNADVWVSAYEELWPGVNHVEAYSGANGHLLFEITVPATSQEFVGARLAGGHDLNHDGYPDVVVASPPAGGYSFSGPGHVCAYSGRDQSLLWTRWGGIDLGRKLYDVGDVDADGVDDVAAISGFYSDTAQILSGADGTVLSSIANTFPASGARIGVFCRAGDVDGDQHGDFAYALGVDSASQYSSPPYPNPPASNADAGLVRIFTIGKPKLTADLTSVVDTAGGVQTLALDFGPAFAWNRYRILGSLTGTQPGLATSAGVLPLAVDGYFMSFLGTAVNANLVGATGTLDAQGRATASVSVTANSTRFPRGTVFRHAAVALGAGGSVVNAISREVPLLVRGDPCHAQPGALDDCDGNGVRDSCEIGIAAGVKDCNHNARPDMCDIASGASVDCDGDHVPDECEPDCNSNHRADACDITAGSSVDCNNDGIPDECSSAAVDMNGNHIPDACEPTTRYVDDDAPNDPGPGATSVSDPLEDGSLAHPFDSLAEAVAVSTPYDEIVIEDGLYTGPDNRKVAVGHVGVIRSRNGPAQCEFDAEYAGGVLNGASTSGVTPRLVQGLSIVHSIAMYSNDWGNAVAASGDLVIRDCRFAYGSGPSNPGLVVTTVAGHTVTIERCIFSSNTPGTGAGFGSTLFVNGYGGNCIVRDCLFAGNASPQYRTSVDVAASTAFDHCTFVAPSSAISATLRVEGSSSLPTDCTVRNSIFTSAVEPLNTNNYGTLGVSYSLVQSSPGFSSPSVFSADPLFVNASGGDYHVRASSPCLDAGDPQFTPAVGETDCDGQPRLSGLRTDIGWDERP